MKTAPELIAEVKGRIKQVTVPQVMEMMKNAEPPTLLDVRDQPEVNLGKIPGAVHISRGMLESKIEAAVPRTANVVIYCASGNRSAFAADTLQQMGYENVASMAGGFRGWADAGGAVD